MSTKAGQLHNTAGASGGGILNNGTVTLNDSTVTGNTPDDCSGC